MLRMAYLRPAVYSPYTAVLGNVNWLYRPIGLLEISPALHAVGLGFESLIAHCPHFLNRLDRPI
jgi:hypothetical protein